MERDYQQAVSGFVPVTTEEVKARLAAGEKTIVFIARPTCPYCRKFAPKLANVKDQKGLTIHYLDSENTPNDPALQDLRNKWGVQTVPSLVTIDGPGRFTNLNIDSSFSEEKVIRLIENK